MNLDDLIRHEAMPATWLGRYTHQVTLASFSMSSSVFQAPCESPAGYIALGEEKDNHHGKRHNHVGQGKFRPVERQGRFCLVFDTTG